MSNVMKRDELSCEHKRLSVIPFMREVLIFLLSDQLNFWDDYLNEKNYADYIWEPIESEVCDFGQNRIMPVINCCYSQRVIVY